LWHTVQFATYTLRPRSMPLDACCSQAARSAANVPAHTKQRSAPDLLVCIPPDLLRPPAAREGSGGVLPFQEA